MTIIKKITIILVLIITTIAINACEENNTKKSSPPPDVVSMKIPQPKAKAKKPNLKKTPEKKKNNAPKKEARPLDNQTEIVDAPDHYNAKGKIDPFKSLIEEEQTAAAPEKMKGPPRILTPLEKIGLSQIKLVAVIEMKNRRIAMVEEASGKGYEVGVGTYIGKNGGKITQIKSSSIIVKELVRNFRGKLSEREQEIRIHKKDIGE